MPLLQKRVAIIFILASAAPVLTTHTHGRGGRALRKLALIDEAAIEIERGRFPYAVSVRRDGDHLCSGALIDREWIVTAKQCLRFLNHYPRICFGLSRGDCDGADPKVQVRTAIASIPSLGEEDTYLSDVAFIKLNESVETDAPLLPHQPPGLGLKMLMLGVNIFDAFYAKAAVVIACKDTGSESQRGHFCATNHFFELSCRADRGSLIIAQGTDISEDVLFGILVEGQQCDQKKSPDRLGDLFVSLFEQKENITRLTAEKPAADGQEPLTLDGELPESYRHQPWMLSAYLPLFLAVPICMMAAYVCQQNSKRTSTGEFPFSQFEVVSTVFGNGWVTVEEDEVRRGPNNSCVRFGTLTWEEDPSNPIAVAVKCIRVRADRGARKRWEAQQNAMECSLGHPNVVKYYWGRHSRSTTKRRDGRRLEVSEYLLVMEKMEMNLMEYVKSKSVDTYKDLLMVLLGVAEGMAYLHKRNILHWNLKVENVMLDEKNIPRIMDFGDATLQNWMFSNRQYIAPEVMGNGSFCDDCRNSRDVYAFGVMMRECVEVMFASSLNPGQGLPGKTTGSTIWGVGGQGYRATEEPIRRLIEQCLQFDDEDCEATHGVDLQSPSSNHGRPSFDEVCIKIDCFLGQPWTKKRIPWTVDSSSWAWDLQ